MVRLGLRYGLILKVSTRWAIALLVFVLIYVV